VLIEQSGAKTCYASRLITCFVLDTARNTVGPLEETAVLDQRLSIHCVNCVVALLNNMLHAQNAPWRAGSNQSKEGDLSSKLYAIQRCHCTE
jgi:hypothetical protein